MDISRKKREYLYSYALANKPPELSMHMHRYYEFIYILSGDLTYLVEDHCYHAEKGDIFFTSPKEIHTINFHSDAVYERHFFQVLPTWLSGYDYNLFQRLDARNHGEHNQIPAYLVLKYGLGDFFHQIQYYVNHELPESNTMIQTFAVQFLVKVNRILEQQLLHTPKENVLVANVKNFISERFAENLSIEQVANEFFISKYYLCHLFKHETGFTIKEFINIKRISKAQRLLDAGEVSGHLYEKCGFNEYSAFYKAFTKLTGKSPRQYQKKGDIKPEQRA